MLSDKKDRTVFNVFYNLEQEVPILLLLQSAALTPLYNASTCSLALTPPTTSNSLQVQHNKSTLLNTPDYYTAKNKAGWSGTSPIQWGLKISYSRFDRVSASTSGNCCSGTPWRPAALAVTQCTVAFYFSVLL